MGSEKLHTKIRDGFIITLAAWSIRSSNDIRSATATATMPRIDGCHSMAVIVLPLENWRSVKDWYSYSTCLEKTQMDRLD